MRLQRWTPGFDPFKEKSTTTQVWVRFYRLPWELWDASILADISRNIGVPLRIDRVTLEGDFRHFARVLVDVDLASTLQHQLVLDCDGNLFDIDVIYEHLPLFCSHCHAIGHNLTGYWHNHSDVVKPSSVPPKEHSRGHSRQRKVWRRKEAPVLITDNTAAEILAQQTKTADPDDILLNTDNVVHDDMVQDVSTSNNNDQNCLTLRQSPDSRLALAAPLPGNDVIPENIDSTTSSQSQAFKELDLVGSQKWGNLAE